MPLVKRSISLQGHRTSVALEAPFWEELERIAKERDQSLAGLIQQVDQSRGPSRDGLAGLLRLMVIYDLRERLNTGSTENTPAVP